MVTRFEQQVVRGAVEDCSETTTVPYCRVPVHRATTGTTSSVSATPSHSKRFCSDLSDSVTVSHIEKKLHCSTSNTFKRLLLLARSSNACHLA